MKNTWLYVLCVIFVCVGAIFGCNTKPSAYVIEYYENGDGGNKSPKIVHYYVGSDSLNYKEVQYYEDGVKKMEGNYVNNEREGEFTAWHRNGNIWSNGNYVKGKAEGMRRVYYENGKIFIEGEYMHDKRVGEWAFYDTLGVLIKTISY